MEQYFLLIDLLFKYVQFLVDNLMVEVVFFYLEKVCVILFGEIEVEFLYVEVLIVDEQIEEGFWILNFLREEVNDEELSSIFLVEFLVYEQEEFYEWMFYIFCEVLFMDFINQVVLECIGVCVV